MRAGARWAPRRFREAPRRPKTLCRCAGRRARRASVLPLGPPLRAARRPRHHALCERAACAPQRPCPSAALYPPPKCARRHAANAPAPLSPALAASDRYNWKGVVCPSHGRLPPSGMPISSIECGHRLRSNLALSGDAPAPAPSDPEVSPQGRPFLSGPPPCPFPLPFPLQPPRRPAAGRPPRRRPAARSTFTTPRGRAAPTPPPLPPASALL
jgi:hypothetical protein